MTESKCERCQVYVARVLENGDGRSIIEAKIPYWRRDRIIDLSGKVIPAEIKDQIRPGTFLLADVNLAAKRVRDLGLSNIDLADNPSCPSVLKFTHGTPNSPEPNLV